VKLLIVLELMPSHTTDGRSVCVVRYGTAAGVLGVVWFVLWMVCASESPTQHGRINTAERQYIVDTLMTEAVAYHQVSDHHLQQQHQQQQEKGGGSVPDE